MFKKILLPIASLCCFIAQAQQSNKSILINGVNRTYIQYLPVGFNPNTESLPVVFINHGLGGTNTSMLSAGFNTVADTARIIVLYPQGLPNLFGQNSWNNGTLASSTANDLAFFSQMMDSVIVNHNANPARIHATGLSMGAIMSFHLACQLNDRIAGVGAIIGTMSTSDLGNCNTSYATPIIQIHGTADPTVPYENNPLPSLSTVPQTLNFWKNVHTCANTSDSTRYTDVGDTISVDRFVYNNCSPAGSVEHLRMNGAGHIYPFQPFYDITGVLELWRFLRPRVHSNPASLGEDIKFIPSLSVYPNPSTDMINVLSSGNLEFSISNDLGQLMQSGTLINNEEKISIKNYPNGVYFVHINGQMIRFVKI